MPLRKSDLTLCSCPSSRENLSDFPELKEILPSDYKYNVCNWNKVDADCFESRFRVNVTTEAEAHVWLSEFSAAANVIFKKQEGIPKCKDVVIFSLRCKHTTRGASRWYEGMLYPVFKQSICLTRLVIILKLPAFVDEKIGSDDDVHLFGFPMTVIYHQHHTHLLETSVNSKDLSATNEDIVKSSDIFEKSNLKKYLSATQKSILTSINEIESQLQNPMARSHVTNKPCVEFLKNCFREAKHPEPYQEVLDSLFPAEEENKSDFLLPPEKQLFTFNYDSGALMDCFRGITSKEKASGEEDMSEKVWICPEQRNYKSVEMQMLPHYPLEELFNEGYLKFWNLDDEEIEKIAVN